MRRKMALTRLSIGLLMLMTLTTTCCARSISPDDEFLVDEDTSVDDNALEIYPYGRNEKFGIAASPEEHGTHENRQRIARKSARKGGKFGSRKATIDERKSRRSLKINETKMPFNARRLEKMMEKAIIKIITGDLSTADMLLLKSLNYSLEEVLAIRERELRKKTTTPENFGPRIIYDDGINDLGRTEGSSTESAPVNDLIDESEKKSATTEKSAVRNVDDFDFDAYNKQAVYDYENGANKMYQQSEFEPISSSLEYDNRTSEDTDQADNDDEIRAKFDRANESHVVFKIRYDDSEFDSSSDEKGKHLSREILDRVQPKFFGHSADNDGRKNENPTDSPSRNDSTSPSFVTNFTANTEQVPFQIFSTDGGALPTVGNSEIDRVTPPEILMAIAKLDDKMAESVESATGGTDSAPTMTTDFNDTAHFTTPKFDAIDENDVRTDGEIGKEPIDDFRRRNIYEGLEWVEDDVYRVIPEVLDTLDDYDTDISDMDNETIDDTRIRDFGMSNEIKNDTIDYLNENPEIEEVQILGGNFSIADPSNLNLSTYQQLALAHRREGNLTSQFDSQGQKAIEDIKLKVLAMTGRFNLSSGSNQVQRERLTMFPPICQIPRNTDNEAWSDPSLMNINFQLNLTSSDHVVVAKLRIYKLPQNNTAILSGVGNDEEDVEEKKIRISVYFYTKSLKKHRSKKRLMDSVVIALTSEGSHLTLDVRSALRFWRQNLRNSHPNGNNHGLVIQVEDQDGRSLKPSQYIQQDSCHANGTTEDDKINESLHYSYKPVLVMFVS